jgi:L-fuculose-phosphate aldolase
LKSRWLEAKQTVLDAARAMAEKGLVAGTSGNVSLRLQNTGQRQLLAITPTSRYYDTLTADDIPVIDFDGQPVEGDLPPSIETPLHIGIYRARENVNAVIHTHSVYACAAAVAGLEIPPLLEEQVAYLGGGIKLAPYAASGTEKQVITIIRALGDRSGVLLANHGAVGTGRTMRAAFTACETIEKIAKVYFLALAAGRVNELSAAAVKRLRALYVKNQAVNS